MLGVGLNYRVGYRALDGTKLSFRFQSDRAFRRFRNNNAMNGVAIGQPFMNDLCEAAQSYNHEGTKMHAHGGFVYTNITFIECLDTKHREYFC